MERKKLLWISPYVPYDTVGHAGGKTENYYLKHISKNDMFDVHLVSCCNPEEKEKLDLDYYNISNTVREIKSNQIYKIIKKIVNMESTLNPFNRYAGILQNYLEYNLKYCLREYGKKLEDKDTPDIVLLEWTETVLLIDYIKMLFPKAKVVSMEEDVSFLRYERKMKYSKRAFIKRINKYKYIKLRKIELSALRQSDLIVVTNDKDKHLLLDNMISLEKICCISPYFDNYINISYKKMNKDILFFGAMSRLENYLSAIWFIENIFSKIEDKECRFIIIGNRPAEQLLKYRSERIIITGFVEDVSNYLQSAMCLVAPLLLGAGIKVKVLEALSAGIPVLTNQVGIEGIHASNQIEYFHCETPEEYLYTINLLIENSEIGRSISENAKEFIKENYNLEKSARNLETEMKELIKNH